MIAILAPRSSGMHFALKSSSPTSSANSCGSSFCMNWRIQFDVGFTCRRPYRCDLCFPHERFYFLWVSTIICSWAHYLRWCGVSKYYAILQSEDLATTVITFLFRMPFQQHSDCFFHRLLVVMSLGYLCFVICGIYLWFTRLFFLWNRQLISFIFTSDCLVSISLWDASRLLKSIASDLSGLAFFGSSCLSSSRTSTREDWMPTPSIFFNCPG